MDKTTRENMPESVTCVVCGDSVDVTPDEDLDSAPLCSTECAETWRKRP